MTDFSKVKWGKARKKPIIIEYGELESPCVIDTLEGRLYASPRSDFVIKGIRGEFYPIAKDIFYETYDIVEPIQTSDETGDKNE